MSKFSIIVIARSRCISSKKASDARKVQKNKGKRKKAGKVRPIFMERKKGKSAYTHTYA